MRNAHILLLCALLVHGLFAVEKRFAVEFTPEHPEGRLLNVSSEAAFEGGGLLDAHLRTMESDSVTLAWDDASTAGPFGVGPGDVQANRYRCEHPCSLYAAKVYMTGGMGVLQLHLWEDFGGEPDITGDMIFPVDIAASSFDGWREVNFEDAIGEKVYIPPLTDFHAGFEHFTSVPNIYYATNNVGQPVAHIYVAADDTWYYLGADSEYYSYKIRLYGIYFDIDTVKSFTDIGGDAGLTSGGRTVAFSDLDNDGYDDVAATGALYWNNGDGTFSYADFDFGAQTSFGDFDGDGWLDAVSVNNPLRLWRNNGDRTFTDVAEDYGFVDYPDPKNCGGFGDMDGDGWLDLYVSYSEDWNDGDPIYYQDHVYHNIAGESFVEITDDLPSAVRSRKYSRGVHFCDFDVDGDQDIYISRYRLHPNILLVNQGDMEFDEEAYDRGVAGHMVSGAYGHTIGSTWCDFDNDGDFDLICANLAHPRFIDFSDKTYIYRNDGDGTFTDIYETSGISYYETHSNPSVGDYDLDGNLDLYISCVYDGYRSFIYRGNGDGTFTPSDYETGIMTDNGWGSAWSDYDNDGDLDLVASGRYGLQLWKNIDAAEAGNHWFKVDARCDITTNNHFAYGTQARLYMPDGRILSRTIQATTGLEGCQDTRIMHFGVGNARYADSLVVLFPGLVRVAIAEPFVVNKQITVYESGEVEGLSEAPEQPEELTLRAHPNPFNSALYITHARDTDVEILDLEGRHIATVAKDKNLWQPTAGTPSGVYLLRTQKGKTVKTERVMYIR